LGKVWSQKGWSEIRKKKDLGGQTAKSYLKKAEKTGKKVAEGAEEREEENSGVYKES